MPCWGGRGKKLRSETRMVRDAFGFEKKREQCLTLSCCSFNPLDEKNIAKLKKKKNKKEKDHFITHLSPSYMQTKHAHMHIMDRRMDA